MNAHRAAGLVVWYVTLIAGVASASGQQGPASVQFGPPLLFEGQTCVMVPFAADGHFAAGKLVQGPAFYLSDNLSGGFGAPVALGSALSLGACFDLGPVHWNNLIITEGQSRQSRLLLNRKATIVRCYIPRAEPPRAPAYLVFAIADSDTNNDGVIDDRDQTVLYISDPLGRTLVPVTPPGARVGTVTFNVDTTALFVQIFNDTDPGGSTILHVDPARPAIGVPLWNSDVASQAMRLVSP